MNKNDQMEGPSTTLNKIDYNSLNIQDLYAIKMIIEKGKRSNIFMYNEDEVADIIHTKVTNIINEIITKNKK